MSNWKGSCTTNRSNKQQESSHVFFDDEDGHEYQTKKAIF